jgi:hypothetical protein
LGFVEYILAFLVWQLFWLLCTNFGHICSQSSVACTINI